MYPTYDTVIYVSKKLSRGAGAEWTYCVSLQYWLTRFRETSVALMDMVVEISSGWKTTASTGKLTVPL